MTLEEKIQALQVSLSFTVESNSTPLTISLDAAQLAETCKRIQTDSDFYFDQLSNVTGIDNGPEAKTMEVIYHLYSIPYHYSLALKVVLPRENPEVDSLCEIWKSANWLERETYDMFGIQFKDHPDLRRILMPSDWEGHPLRKDYQQQETYRDVKVAY
jgi:NADH-quinone oxidoreductase subunit C